MLVLLMLELVPIVEGTISCIRWEQVIWHFMTHPFAVMLVMLPVPYLIPVALLALSVYSLYHKATLSRRHVYLYKRVNLFSLQILFLISTVVSVIAALDYIGVR